MTTWNPADAMNIDVRRSLFTVATAALRVVRDTWVEVTASYVTVEGAPSVGNLEDLGALHMVRDPGESLPCRARISLVSASYVL